jgi:hypothetical protein
MQDGWPRVCRIGSRHADIAGLVEETAHVQTDAFNRQNRTGICFKNGHDVELPKSDANGSTRTSTGAFFGTKQ